MEGVTLQGPGMQFTSEVTRLKEKVRMLEVSFVTDIFLLVTCGLVLQKSHVNLKKKVSEQAAELINLRKLNFT